MSEIKITQSSLENGIFRDGQIVSGYVSDNSEIKSSDKGAHAEGYATGDSSIISSGLGSIAAGFADEYGTIKSNSRGSIAIGCADGDGGEYSLINANEKGAIAIGVADNNSSINAFGVGSIALGYSSHTASISSNGFGAIAYGFSTNNGIIDSSGMGTTAEGYSTGNGAQIKATGYGATAKGFAEGENSHIIASGRGSYAEGCVNTGGTLKASGIGSHAEGFAHENGEIIASGNGSFAIGAASIWESEGSGVIKAEYSGAFAGGLVNSYGKIIAKDAVGIAVGAAGTHGKILTEGVGDGKFALGTANSSGNIISTGEGAIARGMATKNSSIIAERRGSYAGGYANDFSIIDASGYGAHAEGYADHNGDIIAVGHGSFASGYSTFGRMEYVIDNNDVNSKISSILNNMISFNVYNLLSSYEQKIGHIIYINGYYYQITVVGENSDNSLYFRLNENVNDNISVGDYVYDVTNCHITIGEASHIFGKNLIAYNNSQTVVGQYNIPDPSALFIIGTGNNLNDRKSNFSVNQDAVIINGIYQHHCLNLTEDNINNYTINAAPWKLIMASGSQSGFRSFGYTYSTCLLFENKLSSKIYIGFNPNNWKPGDIIKIYKQYNLNSNIYIPESKNDVTYYTATEVADGWNIYIVTNRSIKTYEDFSEPECSTVGVKRLHNLP